jgi:hypothetical protein
LLICRFHPLHRNGTRHQPREPLLVGWIVGASQQVFRDDKDDATRTTRTQQGRNKDDNENENDGRTTTTTEQQQQQRNINNDDGTTTTTATKQQQRRRSNDDDDEATTTTTQRPPLARNARRWGRSFFFSFSFSHCFTTNDIHTSSHSPEMHPPPASRAHAHGGDRRGSFFYLFHFYLL